MPVKVYDIYKAELDKIVLKLYAYNQNPVYEEMADDDWQQMYNAKKVEYSKKAKEFNIFLKSRDLKPLPLVQEDWDQFLASLNCDQ